MLRDCQLCLSKRLIQDWACEQASQREQYYTNQINTLQRTVHLLKSENAILYVRLQNMAAKHSIYYKDVVELFREIGKVKSDYVKKKDKEDDEDE